MRIAFLLLAPAALGLFAAQNPPNYKVVPVTATSASSGQQMFNTYCASCHGTDARGGGPVASALKKAPADLTQVATRHNGKFPELDIYHEISGDGDIAAHGTQQMPVWGDVLKSLEPSKNDMVRLRISNLVAYIKSLQRK